VPTVVGVKLRFASKATLFDATGAKPGVGDSVVVETERGTELGQVVEGVHEAADGQLPTPLHSVVRVATGDDLARAAELAEKERAALKVFRELIGQHKIDMKPIEVEHLFGGEKVVFYFTAEERVDFRALVRELASRMHARVDMRQVGVRDEARMVGGLGHCGQQLCCARFAGEFQPVSVRMAKEQDLPLNPLKISGLCGRLMCCLRYEFEAYKEFKSRAPKRGTPVETPLGAGKVAELNTPRETVRVQLAQGGSLTVPLASMQCERGCPCKVDREALEALDDVRVNGMLGRMGQPAAQQRGVAEEPGRVHDRERGGHRENADGGQRRERSGEKAREAQEGPRRSRRRRGGSGGTADSARPAPAAEEAAPGVSRDGGSEKKDGDLRSAGRRRRRRRPPGTDGSPGS